LKNSKLVLYLKILISAGRIGLNLRTFYNILIWLCIATLFSGGALARGSWRFLSASEGELGALQDLIDRAVETHPSIAAAAASARAAGADVRAAKWQRFPSFSVEGLLLDQPGNIMQAQAVVDQPLWTGGRISGAINRASARAGAALAAYDEAVQAIAISTAQAFFEVHRWRERSKILSESLEQHNSMVVTMERRYAQKVSPLSDLELARSRALQIEQQLYQSRAQEGAASSRLRQLLGDPFLSVGRVPSMPQAWLNFTDEGITTQALGYSPALKRLRFDAQAVDAEARIARASILPQLSGQYSYNEIFGHRVGLVLRAQSDGGLSRFAAAEAARQRVQASELQIAAGERQLLDQTFALLREYEAATGRLAGSESASASARLVMESYMRQFTSGRRTWLDVMNAVREANTAEIDVIEARMSAQSSLSRIMLLSGQWAPLELPGDER
jgi:adhesin transport system outer membrane protein